MTDPADKEFNNTVTPPEEPKFQPEKYVLSKDNGKFDITGTKLLDDDKELTNKYAETNANPYADDPTNNEAENINTKAVKRDFFLFFHRRRIILFYKDTFFIQLHRFLHKIIP